MRVIKPFVDQKKASIRKLLRIVGLSKSSYYYESTSGKRGTPASTVTIKSDGTHVSNADVVALIQTLLMEEFVDYGYHKVTRHLRREGFVINPKKVYRLMKEKKLLHPKRIKPTGSRTFVCIRKVKPKYPFDVLEMDIKYMHVQGEGKTLFLLTLLDVFSRRTLGHLLKRSIRQQDVVSFLKPLLDSAIGYDSQITIRTDNGSQFIAHSVRDFIAACGVKQEFTHVATPEENGHIEAFHSILERELVRKQEFASTEELVSTLERYYEFYNTRRIHGRIGYQTPDEVFTGYFLKHSASNFLVRDNLIRLIRASGG